MPLSSPNPLEYHPYSEFLETVRELHQQSRTGTLFVTTDDHHSVRIMLIQGAMVDCYYGHRRGVEALENLNNAPQCRYRFAEGLFVKGGKNDQMPSTEVLLALLTRFATDAGEVSNAMRPRNPTLFGEAIALTTQHFVRYLGPFAPVLVQDALRSRPVRQPNDLTRLVDMLSDELEESEGRRQFRDELRSALQNQGFLSKPAP